ncbi:MAG: threonine/homoserine/homoserine lactone efflux protein [Candidatus Endobugula sp.]|jgi:threonine/homoserine/homoserine lactone efflux protein
MTLETLLIYTVVSFFYILSPGPAVFLAMSNGLSHNMKVVAVSSLANILGLFCLSAVSIVGLGAILLSSSYLFLAVKIIGAVYLVFLGVKQFFIASRAAMIGTDEESSEHKKITAYFLESFILAVTNPKPILFFIALFPQFLQVNQAAAPQFFVLTSIFMVLSFFVLCSYGYISKSARALFKKATFVQWFHRITGGLFIVMGFSLLKLKSSQI